MNLIVVDVEADGPCPGLYSMVSLGAATVEVNPRTFYHEFAPITNKYIPEALSISNITREQHMSFPEPIIGIHAFNDWLLKLNKKPKDRYIFISDNPAFDWQFVNYYFHKYLEQNPFGYSARRIGDLYSGIMKDLNVSSQWKKFRKTAHTHNPVNDAIGNVEALLEIKKIGLKGL